MTKKEATKKPNVISDNTKLKLTLVWSEIETEYQKILKTSAKNIKTQGFRKGKVPLKIAEEKIGKERLINKTLEVLIPPQYDKLIKKEKKQPLTQPQINPIKMKWGEDWELEIQIAEKPAIKLDSYQKSVKKGLKAALKQLQEQKKTALKQKTTATKKNQAKATKKLTPEQKDAQERETKLHQIFKTLVEDIQPQIPELLLKEETKREIQRMAQELEKIGLSIDDYLTRRGQKFEEMSSQVAAQVLGQLQLEFILREIEQKENIIATKKETQQELDKMKDQKMKQQIEHTPHYLDYLNQQIKRRKLIDQLLDIK